MQELLETRLDRDSPELIRQRADEDGYVFVRELVAPDKIRNVCQDIVTVLDKHRWLRRDGDIMLARAAVPACGEGDARFWPVFDDIQRLESFHALAHDAGLSHLARIVLHDNAFAHPRNIVRLMFPGTPTTPPHQDNLYIRGAINTWTAWIPLGDCPRELGGLTVLPGSHRNGLLPTEPMAGAGGRGIPAQSLTGEWRMTDYRCGDVLFIHSLCVHKSTTNATGDRLRMSVDYRYQRCADQVEARALAPHFGRETWDDIYRGWSNHEYQYYWRQLPLKVVEQSRSFG